MKTAQHIAMFLAIAIFGCLTVQSSENELLDAAVVLKNWSKLEEGMPAKDVFNLLGPNSLAAMIYGDSSQDSAERTYTQDFHDGRGGNKYMSIKLEFERGGGLHSWEMWQSQSFKDTLRKNGSSQLIQ